MEKVYKSQTVDSLLFECLSQKSLPHDISGAATIDYLIYLRLHHVQRVLVVLTVRGSGFLTFDYIPGKAVL